MYLSCYELAEIVFKEPQSEREMINKGDYNTELTDVSIAIKFEPKKIE